MAWIGLIDAETGPADANRRTRCAAPEVTLEVVKSLLGNEPAGGGLQSSLPHALRTGQHVVLQRHRPTIPQAASWRAGRVSSAGYRAMAALPLKRGRKRDWRFQPLRGGAWSISTRRSYGLLDDLAADISFALEMHEREAERASVSIAHLRESEERFRQLAENIQEVFWMTDPTKNADALHQPGSTSASGDARPRSFYESPRGWMDAVHPDDRERIVASAYTSCTCAATTTKPIASFGPTVPCAGFAIGPFRSATPDGTIRSHRWHRGRHHGAPAARGAISPGPEDGGLRPARGRRRARLQQHADGHPRLRGDADDVGPSPARCRCDAAREIVEAADRAANLTRQLLAFSRRQVHAAASIDLNEIVTQSR